MMKPKNRFNQKRRRLVVLALLCLSSAHAFFQQQQHFRTFAPAHYPNHHHRPHPALARTPLLHASTEEKSRFGVRKRVKAVLQKAQQRTGIKNTDELNGISEAASLGALQSSSADLFYTNGKSYPAVNDTETRLALDSVEKSVDAEMRNVEVDALLNSPIEPLPFVLPELTQDQKDLLEKGERIQEQSKMGREGSGYVVVDIAAPSYVVWECLLDFEAYPEYIGTVKSMRLFTNTDLKSSYIAEKVLLPGTGKETRHYGKPSITRASFVLSKFRLNIAAVHKYRPHPDGHYMVFTLDKACKNMVLQDAKGIWYTESDPDGRKGVTRVYLLCEVKISPALPTFIVDYAARKAMPRATTWLKPTVEEKAQNWL